MDTDRPTQQESRVCPFCKGTGSCGKCEGRGVRPAIKARRRMMIVCNACDATKVCQLCMGTGSVGTPNESVG